MTHSDFLTHLDKWEAALGQGVNVDQPNDQEFKESNSEVLAVAELESFLCKMAEADSA